MPPVNYDGVVDSESQPVAEPQRTGNVQSIPATQNLTKELNMAKGQIQDLKSELTRLDSVSERNQNDTQAQIQTLLSEMAEMKKRFAQFSGIAQDPWREVGTSNQQQVPTNKLPQGHEKNIFNLSKDVFSIIAIYDWQSVPFWGSIFVVFGIQLFLVILLLVDQLCPEDCDNILGMPANVEVSVRIAQSLALLIALVSQGDLLLGIEGLLDGIPKFYNGDLCLSTMTQRQWRAAYFLRFLQGILGFVASFVLILQSESVFDVLLNFLGVKFISDLDDLAFFLGQRGYFGKNFQDCAETVATATFLYQDKASGSSSSGSTCVMCKLKEYGHIVGLAILLLISILVLGYLSAISDDGAFSVADINVEFGDEVVSYLGMFNGCYEASISDARNRRPIYRQVGHEADGGKFAFCNSIETRDGDKLEGWVFFYGEIDSGSDYCKSYLLRSARSNSFDLLTVAALREWYTEEGLPVEFALILEIQTTDTTGYCGYNAFRRYNTSCAEVYVSGEFINRAGATSQVFKKLPPSAALEDPQILDATLSHPIYYGNSSSELLLFTGRRWVLTDVALLDTPGFQGNNAEWDIDSLQDYFYSSKMFQALDGGKGGNWVLLISEGVEMATDPLTPFGLQWYSPRYEDGLAFAFPFADLARPSSGNLGCSVCNDETNPCFFEGKCLPTGQCECGNRTSGFLCQDIPVGDGICDDRFNTEEYAYDGGDCCGFTCVGDGCGQGGLTSPFGYDLSYLHQPGLHVPRAFDSMSGYERCLDPNMIEYSIRQIPLPESMDFCILEALTVKCGGRTYLETPIIDFDDGDNSRESKRAYIKCRNTTVSQSIHLPSGAVCEVTRTNGTFGLNGLFNMEIYRHDGSRSTLVAAGDNETNVMSWAVPSDCLLDTLSDHANLTLLLDSSTPQGSAISAMTQDGFSEFLCNDDSARIVERCMLCLFSTLRLAWLRRIGTKINALVGGGTGTPATGGAIPSELTLLSNLDHFSLWFKLAGTIPPTLSGLSKLTHLDISRNDDLHGTIPTEIFSITSLNHLAFDWCRLSGSIPTEIGYLTGLTYLDLHRNSLSGSIPTEIGKLTALEWLSIEENSLSGSIPTEIGKLTALERLSIEENSLSGSIPTEIGKLTALERLSIEENSLSGSIPTEIGKLTALKYLSIEENNIRGDIPTEMGFLTHLRDLEFDRNSLSGSILPLLDCLVVCNNLVRFLLVELQERCECCTDPWITEPQCN